MKKKLLHKPNLEVCKECYQGSCCRQGVEADLFEVARILKLDLDIPRPWFDYVGRDKRSPSGYVFSTVLKNRRCIFQDDNMRCRIYEVRPRYCSEFPFEDGKVAPYYKHLCHHPKAHKRNKRKKRRSS
ncbi:MAG: YkgJ family cysteine cluster protein [Candidatus Omnitrophota bacterium]